MYLIRAEHHLLKLATEFALLVVTIATLSCALVPATSYGSEQVGRLLRVTKAYKLFNTSPDHLTKFSADGTRLIQWSGRSVQVGDTTTGRIIFDAPTRGEEAPVSLALNKTGSIAAASYRFAKERTSTVWDVSSGKVIADFETFGALALSPDGKRLASQYIVGNIEVFDIPSGRSLVKRKISLHPLVGSLTFSPDGESLVFASDFDEVYFLSSHTLWPINESWPHIHTLAGSRIAFSPSGERLVLFDVNRAVILDVLTGGQLSSPLHGHSASISSVTFSCDGRYLYTIGNDGMIGVWDGFNGQRLDLTQVWPRQIYFGQTYVRPDGQVAFAIGHSDGDRKDRGIHAAELAFNLPSPQLPSDGIPRPLEVPIEIESSSTGNLAEGAAFHQQSGAVALASGGAVWVRRGDQECSTQNDTLFHEDPPEHVVIREIRFSLDGQLFAVQGDKHIHIFDTKTCKPVSLVKGYRDAMTFAADEQLVYVNKQVLSWANSRTGKIKRRMKLQLQSEVYSLAVARSGLIAVGTKGGDVVVMPSQSNTSHRTVFRISNTFVWPLRFTPDGKLLIVAGGDGLIHVIDIEAMQVLPTTFPVGDNAINDIQLKLPVANIAVSNDKTRLGAAYADGTIRVWDMQTGRPLTVRLLAGANALDLMFDPADGSMLTIDGESRVLRWKLP